MCRDFLRVTVFILIASPDTTHTSRRVCAVHAAREFRVSERSQAPPRWRGYLRAEVQALGVRDPGLHLEGPGDEIESFGCRAGSREVPARHRQVQPVLRVREEKAGRDAILVCGELLWSFGSVAQLQNGVQCRVRGVWTKRVLRFYTFSFSSRVQ